MEYRALNSDEMYLVAEPIRKLADHHNHVAVSFARRSPIRPAEDQLRELGEMIAQDKARVVGAFAEHVLIGFCASSFENEYGEIDFLYVEKDCRAEGVGAALLDDALGALREHGVTLVDACVVEGNTALTFYKKHGFRLRSRTLSLQLE